MGGLAIPRDPLLHGAMKDLGRRTLVMGILNITPDSFSDGGHYLDLETALGHAVDMEAAGADLIDVGAESTRPQATALTLEEEWSRLEPILAPLRDAVRMPISIDTYKADIARRALDIGVDMVNDVWAGMHDPDMYRVIAQYGCPYVMMHNAMGRERIRGDVTQVVRTELMVLAERAMAQGVSRDQIILDPGIGFGKSVAQNLQLINELDLLRTLGFPVLIGTSRKSFIGITLNVPVEERVEGTAATVAIAIARGADIVRVHDVAHISRVARMSDSLVRL